MTDTRQNREPEEGPNGIDRWTSNGYGLMIDGVTVTSPAEKEANNGKQAEEDAPGER